VRAVDRSRYTSLARKRELIASTTITMTTVTSSDEESRRAPRDLLRSGRPKINHAMAEYPPSRGPARLIDIVKMGGTASMCR
jgi:hypothetical protein